MLFIARFTDKLDMGELRESLFPAHLKWLEENKDSVLVPGALRSDVEGASLGGSGLSKRTAKRWLKRCIRPILSGRMGCGRALKSSTGRRRSKTGRRQFGLASLTEFSYPPISSKSEKSFGDS